MPKNIHQQWTTRDELRYIDYLCDRKPVSEACKMMRGHMEGLAMRLKSGIWDGMNPEQIRAYAGQRARELGVER